MSALTCPAVVKLPDVPELPSVAPSQPSPQPSAFFFKEIFAGCRALTNRFRRVRRKQRFTVLEPLEAYRHGVYIEEHDILSSSVFIGLKARAAHPRQLWHFGTPCSSFSRLQNLNGGTRNSKNPSGDGSLEREQLGNELLRRSIVLIKILIKHGNFWTLENPTSSLMFWMPSVKRLTLSKSCHRARLHQCMYGLQLPGSDSNTFCKKDTTFIGNLPDLDLLSESCSGLHVHEHVIGGLKTPWGWKRKSELAGAYPPELCKKYEQIAALGLLKGHA